MKQLYSIIIFLLIAVTANAQWAQLQNAELSTVEYNGIIYTGSAAILITEGGIFRSTDNGLTWNLTYSGLDTASIGARDITFISARNEVWVSSSNSLFRSTDHGATWSKSVPTGLPQYIWIDQVGKIGNRLVIMYSHWDDILMTNTIRLGYSDDGSNWIPGVVLSVDNSTWWDFISDDNDKALYFVEYPTDGGNERLWYTTNATSRALLPLTGLTDPDINNRSFSVEPQGDVLLFADEGGSGYWRYNFGTEIWEPKMNGIGLADHTILMVFRAHSLPGRQFGTVLFADAGMNMVMKLYTSTDAGDNWTEISNTGLQYPLFESQMIIAGSNRIIAGHFHSALTYSDNNGQTWTKSNGIQAGIFSRFTGLANGDLFAVPLEQTTGLLRSTDNGNTWTQQNGNLVSFQGIYLIIGIQAGGNYLYLSAATSPFDEKMGLYLSTDYGNNWAKLTNAPDSSYVQFVGTSGIYPIVHFSNEEDNGTYQFTKDAGSTWINITPGIDVLGVDRVLGFKGNGNLGVLMLFAEKNFKTRVYMSTNDGGIFTDITYNLDGNMYDILIGNRWGWDTPSSPVAAFRQDGGDFIMAAWNYTVWPNVVSFYKLNPAKDGWIRQDTEGLPMDSQMELHSLRNLGGVWYFVTSAGVLASINDGVSWQPVWNNEGFQPGIAPASFALNNYGAYLGTNGAGIWRAQLTAPVLITLPATDITDTTAVSGATVTSTGGLPFGGKGLCWSLTPNPTVVDNVIWVGDSWDNFADTLRNLSPNTNYYVRSVVYSPKGMGQPVYGTEITFKTDQATTVDTREDGSIVLFPNPSDGRFNILVEKEWSMTLIDTGGKIVMVEDLYAGLNEIGIKNPVPGIYFARLTGPSGETQIIRVIVK